MSNIPSMWEGSSQRMAYAFGISLKITSFEGTPCHIWKAGKAFQKLLSSKEGECFATDEDVSPGACEFGVHIPTSISIGFGHAV